MTGIASMAVTLDIKVKLVGSKRQSIFLVLCGHVITKRKENLESWRAPPWSYYDFPISYLTLLHA